MTPNSFEAKMYQEPEFIPELTPVSKIDVDRMPPMNMHLPMSDCCPECGGHRLQVGDYVCWGMCYICFEQAEKEIK